MAKWTYGQDSGKVVDLSKLPRKMRRVDPEWDVVTFREGPIARLLSRRR